MSWSTEMRLESIVVGDRARKDLGDIDALVDSIRNVGLIHPPAVDLERNLVAGARRLEALRRLGWDKTLVTVIRTRCDALRNLQIERDENTCREPLLPSEAAALADRMWALEAEKSLANKAEGGRAKASGNFPQAGQTRDRVADAVTGGDMSGRTLEKARTVTHAADDPELPDPVREVAREAVREMDSTGKVDPAYRKVKAAQDAAMNKILGQDPEIVRAGHGISLYGALEVITTQVAKVRNVPAADLASAVRDEDEADLLVEWLDDFAAWCREVRDAIRPTALRVVKGGNQ